MSHDIFGFISRTLKAQIKRWFPGAIFCSYGRISTKRPLLDEHLRSRLAWERFLSAQGHNPWEKDDALSRYQADFRR